MTDVDYNRQTRIFDPAMHRGRLGNIALIGCGAIGSAMALTLAKMGIMDFTIYDPDTVEVHNVPNQLLYGIQADGISKVDYAVEGIEYLTGQLTDYINTNQCPATGRNILNYDTVILALDSLRERNKFWGVARKSDAKPYRYLDLRMGGLVACCYAAEKVQDVLDVHPSTHPFPTAELSEPHWPHEFVDLYTPLVDGTKPADEDPCGARSFLPTAMMCAALGGYTIAAWGRGDSVPYGQVYSFECPTEPFQILHTPTA